MKVIAPHAYNALRDALSTIVWFKPDFETYVRAALSTHPEILAGLDFKAPKRENASEIVSRLLREPARYQASTIAVMLDIASMDKFPYVEKIRDTQERAVHLQRAISAVEILRSYTKNFNEVSDREAKRHAARAAHAESVAAIRTFSDDLAAIKQRYLELGTMENPQLRGPEFERMLNELFALFDLDPRLSYNLTTEQIDGALTFDTDDYIIEAKWWKVSVGRPELDVFDKKIERKSKNTVGLFISNSGFTSDALEEYQKGTSFLAVDGEDLFYVLDGRIALPDMIYAKRRHASETGSCMLRVRDWLAG